MTRRTIEKAFTAVTLYLSTGAVLPLVFAGGDAGVADPDGNAVIQAVWTLIYLCTVLLVALRWKDSIRSISGDKLLLLLVLMAVVSVLWSTAPDVALRRSVALLGTTLFGVYVAQRYSIDELLSILALVFLIAALSSFVFVLAVPEFGVDSDKHLGAWRGVYTHKNTLGRTMALGALVFVSLIDQPRRRLFAWIGVVICSSLLLMSNSATAQVVLIGSILVGIGARNLRLDLRLLIPFALLAAIILVATSAWIYKNYELILNALGREATLTGRTFLWSLVIESIGERPWLGYGFGSYWLGWSGASASIWSVAGWEAPHAHNGFLDLCLNLGVFGLALCLAGISCYVARAATWARSSTGWSGLWPMMLLAALLAFNLTESVILVRNNITWILYVDLVIRMARRRLGALVGGGHVRGGSSRRMPASISGQLWTLRDRPSAR